MMNPDNSRTGIEQIARAVAGQSNWRERAVAVLVCYLDDSGTEAGSPVVVIAGYVASVRKWAKFEKKAGLVFRRYGVTLLHTKDFHHSKKEFKSWSGRKKIAFAKDMCKLLKEDTVLGVSAGSGKKEYKRRCEETGLNPSESAFGFSFRVLIHRILQDDYLNRQIKGHGLSFIVEQGNQNEGDILRIYNSLAVHGDLKGYLKSLSFVSKDSSIAIQMADFLAFHSRRWAEKWYEAEGMPAEKPEIIALLEQSVRHTGRLAVDFGR